MLLFIVVKVTWLLDYQFHTDQLSQRQNWGAQELITLHNVEFGTAIVLIVGWVRWQTIKMVRRTLGR